MKLPKPKRRQLPLGQIRYLVPKGLPPGVYTVTPAAVRVRKGQVHDGGRFVSFHQCRRKATLQEKDEGDGKVYGFCHTHAPSTQRAAGQKREARWQAEEDEREAGRKVAKAEARLVARAMAWFESLAGSVTQGDLAAACAAVKRARAAHDAARAAVPS